MKEGQLEGQNFYNPYGVLERVEYTWVGGPEAYISNWMFSEAKLLNGWRRIQIGPYKLRASDWDNWYNYHQKYIREDYPFWRIVVFWHRASRILDLFYRRIIYTLVVWNLAERTPGAIPYYGDIKLVIWLKKKYTQLKKFLEEFYGDFGGEI